MRSKGCLGCDHSDRPRCYAECPTYKALKEDFAKRNAFLKQNNKNNAAFEFSHVDLAKRRKKHK